MRQETWGHSPSPATPSPVKWQLRTDPAPTASPTRAKPAPSRQPWAATPQPPRAAPGDFGESKEQPIAAEMG